MIIQVNTNIELTDAWLWLVGLIQATLTDPADILPEIIESAE
jgi:hypothetical protein